MTFKDKLIADNVSVAAGGTQYSDEVDLDNGEFQGTFAYHVTSLLGSAEVALQFSYGLDADGVRVWTEHGVSTEQDDEFPTDGYKAEKARIRFTETGGTSGLEGVMGWAKVDDE